MKSHQQFYLKSISAISAQESFESDAFLATVKEYDQNVLACIAPDYKQYINPIQLRRLSRMLRMGLSAATACLRKAQIETPDAIISATGYGFLEDTAKFLNEVINNNESQLTPTFFIQSTYNALAGLIALQTKCMGYNTTYANRGFAFETALQDAMMQISMNGLKHVLVAAYDEKSLLQYQMNGRIGHYKKEFISNLKLYESETIGSLQGEGTTSVLISIEDDGSSICVLKGVQTLYKPKDAFELKNALQLFLSENNLDTDAIDVVINGLSGDVENDKLNRLVANQLFSKTKQVYFKHLVGEYCTASSFALWVATMLLEKQFVPDALSGNEMANPSSIQNVLILNQYMGKNYTFMLLAKK